MFCIQCGEECHYDVTSLCKFCCEKQEKAQEEAFWNQIFGSEVEWEKALQQRALDEELFEEAEEYFGSTAGT